MPWWAWLLLGYVAGFVTILALSLAAAAGRADELSGRRNGGG